MRHHLSGALSVAIECSISLLAVSSVWLIGSRPASFQWLVLIQVAVLLSLWGLKAVVEQRILWKPCWTTTLLAGLCVLGIFQVVPLPSSWVAWLSPGTVRLREAFSPSVAEFGAPTPASATVSLDPGESRVDLLLVIAWVSLFAAVRNTLTTPGAITRFAWLMTANGVALSLVGMGQLAGPKNNLIFWTIPNWGPVFGPFITRTHGADYLSLCLGLALGLLAGTRGFLNADGFSWRDLFRDPRVTWLTCGVGVMFAGLLASLSRGGLGCFLVSAFVCFAFLAFRPGGRGLVIGGVIVIVLAAALIFWQLPDRFAVRWEQTRIGEASVVERAKAWQRSYPLIAEFPVFGSGMNTYAARELLVRRPADIPYYIVWNHAHNEYLETWIEGGTVALVLVLAVVALVLARGYDAFRRRADTPLGRLALGALMGILALVLHSVFDFGLRTPAVAVLATIVGGLLLNLADLPAGHERREPSVAGSAGGLMLAIVQLVALVAVGAYLVVDGWRVKQAERYWLASRYEPHRLFEYSRAAAEVSPERAKFDVSMAGALMEKYVKDRSREEISQVAALVAVAGVAPFPAPLGYCRVTPFPSDATELQTANALLLQACRKSPLNYDAHEALERLSTMEPFKQFRKQRLERLVRLSPSQPFALYRAGGLALDERDKPKAFTAFRDALAARKDLLPRIAQATPSRFTRTELLTEVLRDDPKLVFDAAKILSLNGRRTFPEEAEYYKAVVASLDKKPRPLAARDVTLKAHAHLALAERQLAVDTMKAAVGRSPADMRLRVEFAKVLSAADDDASALTEIAIVKTLDPKVQGTNELENHFRERIADKELAGRLPKQLADGQGAPIEKIGDVVERVRGAIVRVDNTTTKRQGNAVALKTVGGPKDRAYLLTSAHGIESNDDRLEVLLYPPNRGRVRDDDPAVIRIADVGLLAKVSKDAQDLALLEVALPPGVELEGLALPPAAAEPAVPFSALANWCFSASGPGIGGEPIVVNDVKVVGKGERIAKFWKSEHVPTEGESGSPIVDARSGRLLGICKGTPDGKVGDYVHVDEIREFLRKRVRVVEAK